jgi:hypothetical protein
MTWPWVSRKTLEATEARLRWTETELHRAEAEKTASEFLAGHWRERCDHAEADNKLLLDRIVQLAGQPPIFHPLPIVAAPEPRTAQESSAIPAPAIRRSPDEIKRMARTAIERGDFDKPKPAAVA